MNSSDERTHGKASSSCSTFANKTFTDINATLTFVRYSPSKEIRENAAFEKMLLCSVRSLFVEVVILVEFRAKC